MRRLPQERSRLQQQAAVGRARARVGAGGCVEEVEDVAMLFGCFFCQIPEGRCKGQWHPMLLVWWMRYCDPIPHIQVPEGQGAALARGAKNLQNLGVECFEWDDHELGYMLHIDHVSSIVYYQNGYYTIKAGEPDFFWVDTLWDTL